MLRNVRTVLIQKPVNFVEFLLLVKIIELSIALKLVQTKLKLKLKNKRNIHVVIYVKAADLNSQQGNEEINTATLVMLYVELAQTVDDLKLRTTNIVINVKIYLIALYVRVVVENSRGSNVLCIVVNVGLNVYIVDEKYRLFIMGVALNLAQ